MRVWFGSICADNLQVALVKGQNMQASDQGMGCTARLWIKGWNARPSGGTVCAQEGRGISREFMWHDNCGVMLVMEVILSFFASWDLI